MGFYNLPHAGKSPSHALLAAVVVQAVDDLTCSDKVAKWEANLFFREQVGGWAEMRKFYFDALGIHEAKAVEALAARFSDVEMPAPPSPKMDDVYAILPDKPFTARQIADRLGVRHNKTASHFQVMMSRGRIKRIARGLYVRHDSVSPVSLPPPSPPPPKLSYGEVRKIVHGHLRERPQKFTELIQSTNGDVSDSAIRMVLRNGLVSGELVRSWDSRYSHSTPHTMLEPGPGEARVFLNT